MSSSTSTTKEMKKVVLRSSDNKEFVIDMAVALESETIKQMVEEDVDANMVPIPNVKGRILDKVLEYCKKHVDAKAEGSDLQDSLKDWDKKFVECPQETLFDLILVIFFFFLNFWVTLYLFFYILLNG